MKNRLRAWAGLPWQVTGPLPRPSLRGYVFDAALALAAGWTGINYIFDKWDAHIAGEFVVGGAPRPVYDPDGWVPFVVLGVFVSGALALRRRYPLAVLWVTVGAVMLTPPDIPRLGFYPCVLAAYSAAAFSPYRIPTVVSLVAAALSVDQFTESELPIVPNQYAPLVILVPIVVAANGLRTWKLRTDAGRAQLSERERELAEELRRATERERARIARELHDVVTHNVSVMVIQAGAARRVMDAAPDQAKEALLAVESGGRAAMTELRHVMGLLTMDLNGSDRSEDLAPQPGLDRLESLIGRVRTTGMPINFTVRGEPREVPPGIELTAYRVVQEALTNTVKHAGGASAAVTIEYAPDHLRVEVIDSGGTPSPSAVTGNGHGLIGLRERLAVYGGTLQAGRRLSGGHRVKAHIPLEAS